MLEHCKNPNSKCFLLTYLAVVVFLLVLWRSGSGPIVSDQREIPHNIAGYLLSPPREISVANVDGKLVLTPDYFINKWTFVYFSHHQCFPDCANALKVLGDLRESFSASDIQFVVIELDPEERALPNKLSTFLDEQGLNLTAMATSAKAVELLTAKFNELFLLTKFADGSYQIEQQHQLFIVDPKSRVYAKFTPPYTSKTIQRAFVTMRYFYAQTE